MIKFLNKYKKFSKKFFSLISLPFFLASPSYSEIIDLNDPETMVKIIIDEASKTMGKLVGAKEVRFQWCEGTYYNPRRSLICLNKEKFKGTSLAFAAAHEYAHHVQYSNNSLFDKRTLRSELQADCFAGIILATIKGISFNDDEVQKMLDFALDELGDNNYDDVVNHHGSGENRALAFRSGLAFGRSKGQIKDNYYKMFCLAK